MKHGRIIQYAFVCRAIVNQTPVDSLLFPGVTQARLKAMVTHVKNGTFVPNDDLRDFITLNAVNDILLKPTPDMMEFVKKYSGVDVIGCFLISPTTSTA